MSGRKNVVWLTAALPFDLIPEDRNITDAELLADLPGQGRQRSVNVNAAGSQAAESRNLYAQEIREAEAQLASANIAIYPVDLRGLVSGMESSAAAGGSVFSDSAITDRVIAGLSSVQASQGTMREIAAQTGGKAYVNQNEIKDGIALAASDEKASYSLGYYPENNKWDGKLRNIKVKVAQGDTQLRYRKGYFAIEPGPTKDRNFEQDVAAALPVERNFAWLFSTTRLASSAQLLDHWDNSPIQPKCLGLRGASKIELFSVAIKSAGATDSLMSCGRIRNSVHSRTSPLLFL